MVLVMVHYATLAQNPARSKDSEGKKKKVVSGEAGLLNKDP